MKVYEAIDELADMGIDPERFWLCCKAITNFIVQEGLVVSDGYSEIACAAFDALDPSVIVTPAAMTILDPCNFEEVERALTARSQVFALQAGRAPSLN